MNDYQVDEIELDIADILANILKGWKKICLLTIICGLVGLGYTLVAGPDVKEVTQDEIDDAVSELSLTDAATVERLYEQYEAYVDYKNNLQKYFSSFSFSDNKVDNQIQKLVQYNLSSKVEGAQSVLKNLALTPEIYDEIRSIAPDYETSSEVYNRITIRTEERDNTAVLNSGESESLTALNYILTVGIIANNRDKCTEIQNLIDSALKTQLKSIQAIDADATLTYIGENYNENLRAWINAQQQTLIAQLQNAETAITNFNNNQVKNLSSDQKKYYDLLVEANAESPVNPSGPSKKKFLLIGLILGMLLSMGEIILKYVLGQDIKVEDELEQYYRVPVLNRIDLEHGKSGLFQKWIKKLREFDSSSASEKTLLTASDIGILMEKNDLTNLYIICSSESQEETKLANELKDMLLKDHTDYTIHIGQPLINGDELKKMYSDKNALLLAQLKHASRSHITKQLDVCRRYDMNVLGAVAIEEF